MKRTAAILALVVGWALILWELNLTAIAEEKEDQIQEETYTESITVTADRMKKDPTASVVIINEEQVENTTADSALELASKEVPGLFLTQRAYMGYGIAGTAAGSVSIRGVGGQPNTQVLILVDGRPDMMGLMGHPLPDAYSLNDVQYIEVIKGPASFYYGTNAMGGVINIITKKMEKEGFQTRFRSGYGSFSMMDQTLDHGGKIGRFDYYLTAQYKETEGDRPHSEFFSRNFSLRLGYQISDRWNICAFSRLNDFKVWDPGTVEKPFADHWFDVNRYGVDFSIQNNYAKASGFVKIYGAFGEHKIYDGFHSHDDTTGISIFERFELASGYELSGGFDLKRFGGEAKNEIKPLDYGEHYLTEYAPYVNFSARFISTITASAGIRYEHNSVFGWESVPRCGLLFDLSKNTAIRLSAAKGFRSPTIRELYLFPAPTPDLKPERMWNYELGVSQKFKLVSFDLAGFYAEGSNLIRTEGQYPNLKLTNSGEFEHKGVEVSIAIQPYQYFDLGINYAWLDPGKETARSPKNRLNAKIGFNYEGLSAALSYELVNGIYGKDNHQERLDDYGLLGLRLAYKYRWIKAFASVENILEEEYEIMTGYPMPGRFYNGGIEIEF